MKFKQLDKVEVRGYWKASNQMTWIPGVIKRQMRGTGRYRVSIDGNPEHDVYVLTADIRHRSEAEAGNE